MHVGAWQCPWIVRNITPVALAGRVAADVADLVLICPTCHVPFIACSQFPSLSCEQPNTPTAHLGTSYSVGEAIPPQLNWTTSVTSGVASLTQNRHLRKERREVAMRCVLSPWPHRERSILCARFIW